MLQALSPSNLALSPAAMSLLPTEEDVAHDRAEDQGKLEDLVKDELATLRSRQEKEAEDEAEERRQKEVCYASRCCPTLPHSAPLPHPI